MERKGIILAGGNGTRLYPLTYCISKQLLPVYDKPMLFYPIQTVLSAGVSEIIFVVKPDQCNNFNNLLKSIKLPVSYKVILQNEPEGIAQVFTLCEEYIKGHPVVLALGDNIFYSEALNKDLNMFMDDDNVIFCYKVKNPREYGVAVFDEDGGFIDVVEKPAVPPSKYAIPGLYFFDSSVVEKAKKCIKSARGEYEITDIMKQYIAEGTLVHYKLPDEAAWFDCGTINDLIDAGNFVKAIQSRTNNIIGYHDYSK